MNNINEYAKYYILIATNYLRNVGAALAGRPSKHEINLSNALSEVWENYIKAVDELEAKALKVVKAKTAPAKKAPSKKAPAKKDSGK